MKQPPVEELLRSLLNPGTASSGIITFAGTNYTKAETIKLKATAAGLTQILTNAITVSAAASLLNFLFPLNLQIRQRQGQILPRNQSFKFLTLMTILSPAQQTPLHFPQCLLRIQILGGGRLNATTNPLGIFRGCHFCRNKLHKAESIKLKAIATGLIQIISNTITVSAAPANILSKTSGDSQSAEISSALTNLFVVTVTERFFQYHFRVNRNVFHYLNSQRCQRSIAFYE